RVAFVYARLGGSLALPAIIPGARLILYKYTSNSVPVKQTRQGCQILCVAPLALLAPLAALTHALSEHSPRARVPSPGGQFPCVHRNSHPRGRNWWYDSCPEDHFAAYVVVGGRRAPPGPSPTNPAPRSRDQSCPKATRTSSSGFGRRASRSTTRSRPSAWNRSWNC